MTIRPLLERIRDLIARGELLVALEELKDFLSGQRRGTDSLPHQPAVYGEVVLHLGRFARAAAERRRGISSPEQFDRITAQLSAAVLELMDQIERSAPAGLAPVSQKPIFISDSAFANFEKIIGRNSQLKNISWLHRGLRCARSVCRVISPRGLGTGFVVNRDILVTNNHVIATLSEAAHTLVEFNFEEDITHKLKKVSRYSLEPSTIHTSEILDCTTVKIVPSDGEDLREWGFLTIEHDHTVQIEDHVTIIQHPQGGFKQICLTDNKVINIYNGRVQYTTDTMPGSSGSPVFNDEWHVVAIHHAGGDLIKNSQGDKVFANEGIIFK